VAFKDLANLAASSKLRAVIEREIEEKNRELARYEQIKKFSVLSQDFTIDTGELTPTLKMKRKVVNEKYKDVIESMYEGA
jgi:long-chain acyl-CoA synthetase